MSYQDEAVCSRAASIVIAVLFLVGSAVHTSLMLYMRSWIMVWLVIGAILETVSYFMDSGICGTQSFMPIIAPVFLAASVYLSFGKFMRRLDLQGVHSRHILQPVLFICADFGSFVIQVAGIILNMSKKSKSAGTALCIVGFAIQMASLCYLLFLVIKAHLKLNADATQSSMKAFYSWKTFIKSLYIVFILLLVRYAYRLAEYTQGLGGYIFFHAVFAYVFDAIPMLLVVLIISIVHPALVEEGSQTEKLSITPEPLP